MEHSAKESLVIELRRTLFSLQNQYEQLKMFENRLIHYGETVSFVQNRKMAQLEELFCSGQNNRAVLTYSKQMEEELSEYRCYIRKQVNRLLAETELRQEKCTHEIAVVKKKIAALSVNL